MPRTPEENDRIRRRSQENILVAAMKLFIKKGYHATSISEVALQAGISKGLLYNYYQGKEQLISEMVETRIRSVADVMAGTSPFKVASEQLQYIAESAIDNVYANPDEYRFYLNLQTQPEADKELIKYSKQLIEESARQFEFQCKIFEKLNVKNPRRRSLYFSSTLQGIMLMISTYPQKFPIEEIKAQIIHEFCTS